MSGDNLWYKDAVIYQIHVRAFADSDGDGIGDFRGLISRLDYLSDLGVNAVWLLPFYPSPLKDDGYDIADYYDVHPSYGTLKDFKDFLKEAHRRKIRVITELVINHTSDQHEWFQRSRRAAEGSYWRNYYVWSSTPDKYKEARIIFKDFESSNWAWDPVAKSYFWHRFYSHQPDLNFDNADVKKSIMRVLDYWMDMGVDGMRLDAIPYLYEREGTSCENLPETHEFLRELRSHVDQRYPGRMLLAEANQWPEDAVVYFGKGDECHMCFHFPLMPRLFMALRMEDRYSIIDIMKQTPEIPENCQWAIFLRNHDELTLEMVTDEERDYMQRVYASDPRARINLGIRRRLAPLVGNDRRQLELLNGALFSMPGTPIIYYGDEIGMGDNIYLGDRNGVRTPFQWSPDRNAGFSRANPQSLYLPLIVSPEYHYQALNVETQQGNANSFLWWMKKLIALRKAYPALNRGTLEFLPVSNPKVLAFFRQQEGQTLLVVANLSRTVQPVELDLGRYRGRVPRELFGSVDFPPIGDAPYFITLGPYAFYWFELIEKATLDAGQWIMRNPPAIPADSEPLHALSEYEIWIQFEKRLRTYLPRTHWFLSRHRKIESIALDDLIHVHNQGREDESVLALIRVNFKTGDPETYLLMLGYAEGEPADRIREERPDMIVSTYTKIHGEEKLEGIYYDAILEPGLSQALLDGVFKRRVVNGHRGAIHTEIFVPIRKEWLKRIPVPRLAGLEQNNSSVVFEKQFHLKYYRRIEEGENPEIEIANVLSHGQATFRNRAQLLGALTYVADKKRYSLGIVQNYVEHETDGWNLMLDHLGRLADRALAGGGSQLPIVGAIDSEHDAEHGLNMWALRERPIPPDLQDMAGYTFSLAELLGKRGAELHAALAAVDAPSFAPEPFTPFYQRSLFQSLRNLTDRALSALRKSMPDLSGYAQEAAGAILASESAIIRRIGILKERPLDLIRIRVHGDFHLAQMLYTGKDFIVVDFEGEPDRSLGERRLKRAALRDVASMLRSFEYASSYFLRKKVLRDEDRARLQPVFSAWSKWMASRFLNGYLDNLTDPRILPHELPVLRELAEVYMLEKALYEVAYETANRPEWLDVALSGVVELIRGHKA